MATHTAVCVDDNFWAACDWTTYEGTVITDATSRDSYYSARYTSLSAWDAAEKKYLIEAHICEIIGPWASAQPAVAMSSQWGASSLVLLTIATVGVARHAGRVSAACYRISVTSGTGFAPSSSTSGVVVDGVIVLSSSTTSDCFVAPAYGYDVTFKNCIAIGGRNGFFGTPASSVGGSYKIINCLAIGAYESGVTIRTNPHQPGYVANCTVHGCNTSGNLYRAGIFNDTGSYTDIINCVATSNTGRDYRLVGAVSPRYCASSDATLNGLTGCQTGIAAAACFTDAANDDFSLLSTAPIRGDGIYVADRVLTDDIIGTLRDPSAIDIGAYQYDTNYVPTLMVALDITGMIEGSVLAIYRTSDHAEIVAPTVIDASGAYSTTYSWTGNVPISVVVRKATGGTKYLPYSAPGLITSGGFGLVVSQVEDLVLNG